MLFRSQGNARAKECVMKTVSTVQENAEDIYADAKAINEERAAAEEAAEFVYTFFASLLDKIFIPAVPKATPAAKIPVFFQLIHSKHFNIIILLLSVLITGIKSHKQANS